MAPDDLLPLPPVHHWILLLLAREPAYGVQLLERLELHTEGRLQPNAGTLYRHISRLVDQGLIRRVDAELPPGEGAPPKVYGITDRGREVLRAEADHQVRLLELARELDLIEEAP